MLTNKQLQNVCLLGAGADQCRYLTEVSENWRVCFCCSKKSQNKDKIDSQLNKDVLAIIANGQDPRQQNRPLGNNCSGYLFLTKIKQGYDVKP